MKTVPSIITFLFISIYSCVASEDVESAVYEAIFIELGLKETDKNIVVELESLGDQQISAEHLKDMIPRISDSAISDFRVKSAEIMNIGLHLPEIPNLIKGDQDKLSEIFSGKYKNPWQQFYKVYSNSIGVLRFSQVATSSSKIEAVVTTRFECGLLCGRGAIVYLKLINGTWVVQEWKQVWVS